MTGSAGPAGGRGTGAGDRDPRSVAVSALLTGLVALGALSTDMSLPMLPTIARELDAPVASVQLTLSVFMAGIAVGQLGYGPLSDRFGRRPLLLAGLGVFVIGGLTSALAPTIGVLIAARFVQAIGACAGPVVARAVVRDVYEPARAATVLAYMASAMALVPTLAPIAGGWLGEQLGWRALFVLMAAIGGGLAVALTRLLGETNRHRRADALRPAVLLATYLGFFRHPGFVGFAFANALMFAGMFAYISGSSFVLVGQLGLAPTTYGFCFAAAAGGYATGAQVAGRLSARLGIVRLVRLGVAAGAAAGGVLLALHVAFGPTVVTIVPAVAVYFAAAGLVMPSAFAGVLQPFPAAAGSAAAMAGFLQMLLAAAAGAVVGALIDPGSGPGAIAMPATIAAMGIAALTVVATVKPRV